MNECLFSRQQNRAGLSKLVLALLNFISAGLSNAGLRDRRPAPRVQVPERPFESLARVCQRAFSNSPPNLGVPVGLRLLNG